jgi:hypothetical protein
MDILSMIDLTFGYAKHGKLHRFTVLNTPGIVFESILRRYRIHAYGRSIAVHDGQQVRSFHVNARQARFAEYLLLRAGIPLASALIDPRNAAAADREEMPTQWQEGRSMATPLEAIGDAMAAIFGRDVHTGKKVQR